MNQEGNDILSNQLRIFDSLKLSDITERRMACKPLYDFFQILVKEAGVGLLGLDKNSLSVYHLKTRWENIKIHLSFIEDPKPWDSLINGMHNIRSKVEHDDYYDPEAGNLKRIRKKAPEFQEWLFRIAKEYYKKSKNLSFKQSFYRMLDYYARDAEWLISEYGEKTPHVAESDFSILSGKDSYLELKELAEASRKRLASASEIADLERSDLDNLINLVRIISKIKGKEEILLNYSVCPKCGGKIVETQHEFGGSEYDPAPTGFVYRIGCEKCDYVIHKEMINI